MPVGVPVIVEGVSATDVRLPVPWDVTLWIEVPRRYVEPGSPNGTDPHSWTGG